MNIKFDKILYIKGQKNFKVDLIKKYEKSSNYTLSISNYMSLCQFQTT